LPSPGPIPVWGDQASAASGPAKGRWPKAIDIKLGGRERREGCDRRGDPEGLMKPPPAAGQASCVARAAVSKAWRLGLEPVVDAETHVQGFLAGKSGIAP